MVLQDDVRCCVMLAKIRNCAPFFHLPGGDYDTYLRVVARWKGKIYTRSGFLNFSTVDILDQVVLCWGEGKRELYCAGRGV